MAGEPKLPASPGQIESTVNALLDRVVKLGEQGRKTSLTQEALAKAEKKIEGDAKRAQRSTLDLGKAVKVLGVESGIAREATKKMATEFGKSLDTMSEEAKEAFTKTIEEIRAAEDVARSQGTKGERDLAILSEKRRQMEVASFRDSLQQDVLKAKALQTSGGAIQRLQGVTQGLWAKAKMLKADTFEKVGGALGMTGQQMSSMAGKATLVLAILAVFNKILKGAAQHANEAAEAGFNVGESLDSAVAAGDNFAQAMFQASMASGMSRSQIIGLANAFNNELGHSITSSYDDSVMLAKQLGGVGISFGVSAEEAVKLGTKMGVLARGGIAGTRILFQNLGEKADMLNINMEQLSEPMLLLAEASGEAGAGVMDSVEGFNAIVEAASGLTALKGPFNQMFATMRDADKVKAVKNFVSNFTKIDDIRWTAFSMKRGENFFDAVGRVSSAGVQEKIGYIGELTKKLGLDRIKNQTQREFTLGTILSGGQLTGDFKATRQLGAMAMLSQGKGEAFDAEARTAALIDQRFARRESVGQYMAGGGDMLALIAHKLENILDVLTSFASNVTKALRFLPGMPSDVNYSTNNGAFGAGSSSRQRQAAPVKGAASLAR